MLTIGTKKRCRVCDTVMEDGTRIDICSGCMTQLACKSSGPLRPDGISLVLEDSNALREDSGTEAVPPELVPLQKCGILTPSNDPDCFGQIDQYEVTDVMEGGGMGLLLDAYEPVTDRHVALKFPLPQNWDSQDRMHRFLREARCLAKVSNPHVVTIHTYSSCQNIPYIVMAYVEGQSLHDRISDDGPMSAKDAVAMTLRIIDGLQAVHAAGIVHRDLKPRNIMIAEKNEPQIVDFGLASDANGASLTTAGEAPGTMYVMAPECLEGDPADVRSDLYSLGATMCQMLTGQAPSAGEGVVDELEKFNVPPWVRNLVGRLMSRDPKQRPQSAMEVAAELTRGPIDDDERRIGDWPVDPPEKRIRPMPEFEKSIRHAQAQSPNLKRVSIRRALLAASLCLCAVVAFALKDRFVTPTLPPPPIHANGSVLVILAHDGFWYPDYLDVRQAAESRGLTVRVAALKLGMAEPDPSGGGFPVPIDLLLDDVNALEFSTAVICGGGTRMFMSGPGRQACERVVNDFVSVNRRFGAICTGMRPLAAFGLLDERPVAQPALSKFQTELAKDFPHIKSLSEPVVSSGPIVTASDRSHAVELIRRLIPHFVLVVPRHRLWLADFDKPRAALQNRGAVISMISNTRGPVKYEGLDKSTAASRANPPELIVTTLVSDLDSATIDGVLICGGTVDELVGDPELARLLQNLHSRGGLVSSVCEGVRVITAAGLATGQKVTGPDYKQNIKDEIAAAHADYVNEPVVVSSGIITARSAADSEELADTLITQLRDQ